MIHLTIGTTFSCTLSPHCDEGELSHGKPFYRIEREMTPLFPRRVALEEMIFVIFPAALPVGGGSGAGGREGTAITWTGISV